MDKTIAVIGHVDHGKTSLVKALTGTNTDTLTEERERGLSIVLGFASLNTKAGRLHFIDAPGHADFIQTTASGMSGADAVLLVVSSADGVSAQTIEHLKLAKLFGIQSVIVALTKSDLSDGDTRTARRSEITDLLTGFGFSDAPVIACSSIAHTGFEEVRDALETVLNVKPTRARATTIYLPIDRVFHARGAGTVVTGTLLGGDLTTESSVQLEPRGIETSIRGVQVAGASVDHAVAGSRVAVNLRNVEPAQIQKGDVLCATDHYAPSLRFDVVIAAYDERTQLLRHMQQIVVLYGAQHAAARVRLYRADQTSASDGAAMAQLEFQTPQLSFAGQHFVIRRPAELRTVAGGIVLDPQAALITRNKSDHVQILEAAADLDLLGTARALAARDQGCVDLELLARLTRRSIEACASALTSDYILDEPIFAFQTIAVDAIEAQFIAALSDFHKARPSRPSAPMSILTQTLNQWPKDLSEFTIKRLLKDGTIRQKADGVALASHDAYAALSDRLRAVYEVTNDRLKGMGLSVSALIEGDDLDTVEQDDMVELLIDNGHAVRLYNHALRQNILLHADAIDEAARMLRQAFAPEDGFTTGQARQKLQTNRKTIVPLLEHFDTLGVTIRQGDLRFAKSPGDRPCDPCDAS